VSTGDSWQRLKGFGYAPGNYMARCYRCGHVVSDVGKRATACLPCANGALIESQAAQIAALKTVMIAAAEEIASHWQAHCDAEGYGPQNLLRRLEEGIPSEYGYTAGAFAALTAERDALRADAERYRWLCNGHGYFMEEEMLCGHSNNKKLADAAIDAARKEQP